METPSSYVLVPGRHHLLTRFQAAYLNDLIAGWREDIGGSRIQLAADPTVVWAVTSANQQNTRRNPVPAHRREAAIELLSQREGLRSLVVPIADVPGTDRFADVTVAAVSAATGGRVELTAENTVVACSTDSVIALYQRLGFRIATLERDDPGRPPMPWELLEMLATGDGSWRRHAHPASLDVVDRYALADHVRRISADPLGSPPGSLVEHRDHHSYDAALDRAAQRTWAQVRPYVRPGRIVDLGCATGDMLELAAVDPALQESDLFGLDIARQLVEECEAKKAQGVFANPSTSFFQRSILAGPVFPDHSIDTTLTVALTHAVHSDGGIAAVERLAAAIARHTRPHGVWVNADVCGPDDPDRLVRLVFHLPGLDTPAVDLTQVDDVAAYLEALPPAGRFAQFANDFRWNSGAEFRYEVLDDRTVRLRIADAMEFLSKHTYTDHWLAESREQFCHLSWSDWRALVHLAGMTVDPRSGPWRNDWLVEHVYAPAATLTDDAGEPVDWPVTHVLLAAQASRT